VAGTTAAVVGADAAGLVEIAVAGVSALGVKVGEVGAGHAIVSETGVSAFGAAAIATAVFESAGFDPVIVSTAFMHSATKIGATTVTNTPAAAFMVKLCIGSDFSATAVDMIVSLRRSPEFSASNAGCVSNREPVSIEPMQA
jgi:hypothetical protein